MHGENFFAFIIGAVLMGLLVLIGFAVSNVSGSSACADAGRVERCELRWVPVE